MKWIQQRLAARAASSQTQTESDCRVKLGRRGYVRAVELPKGQAPDVMTPAEIRKVLRY